MMHDQEHTQTHLKLRRELEERLETLSKRLGRIQSHLRHEDGPLSADFEEQATERENDEVLEALDESGRREMDELKRAIRAIKENRYGTCTECKKSIAHGRLRVLPCTPYCITCASAQQ